MSADKFKIRKMSGSVLPCISCNVATETIKRDTSDLPYPLRRDKADLICSLCYTTLIGNAHDYPQNYPIVTPQIFAQGLHWLKDQILVELKKERVK